MNLSKNNRALLIAYNSGYRIIDSVGVADPNGKLLKPYYKKNYPFFWFSCKEEGQVCVGFHRLAAYQKFGNLIFQKGIEVRHLNGKRNDFSISNLALGTSKDNRQDIPNELRKIHAKPAHLKNRKLSFQQAEKIRSNFLNWIGLKTLFYKKYAKLHKVSQATISNIILNKFYNS
jgi:hypothetical protein